MLSHLHLELGLVLVQSQFWSSLGNKFETFTIGLNIGAFSWKSRMSSILELDKVQHLFGAECSECQSDEIQTNAGMRWAYY